MIPSLPTTELIYMIPNQNGSSSETEVNVFSPDSLQLPLFPLAITEIGGKANNLCKLSRLIDLRIPQWFVIGASLFEQFLKENKITPLIQELEVLCQNFDPNTPLIKVLAEKIRTSISLGQLSPDLLTKILISFRDLQARTNCPAFAVRSSGALEDGAKASYAGLYESFLNVKNEEDLIFGIKQVWISSFSDRLIFERSSKHISQSQYAIGVIVQELIDARASGVVSTIVLGNNYPGIQITANFGLGGSVVEGDLSPDSWVLHSKLNYILETLCGRKDKKIILDPKIGVLKVPVPEQQQQSYCLSEAAVKKIALMARQVKDLYTEDVDIEFAFDHQDHLYVLQARPLVPLKSKTQVLDLIHHNTQEPIASGYYSVPGVCSGNLVFISNWDELASGKIKLTASDIVIAYVTTNTWSQYLGAIGGLITCDGSPSSHPILLCREKGVPCIVGMDEASFKKILQFQGQKVTLDGHNKKIYTGIIPTKQAELKDLTERFNPVQIRQWPNLNQMLPSLIHNKMVIKKDGLYWRKTPTFPIVGFQAEFNLHRFDVIGELIHRPNIKIEARQIEGYVCSLLGPYEELVGLFDHMTMPLARQFHKEQRKCMADFIELSANFALKRAMWERYIELAARFRAYIWLGGALRSYAERKVDEIGAELELPYFYLDQAAEAIQAEMPELDTQMHEEVYHLAQKLIQAHHLPAKDVAELEQTQPEVFHKIEKLGKKYRFEHRISLHIPTDHDRVYKRILKEIEQIQSGHDFVTKKSMNPDHLFLPNSTLREWLKISIENRVLQSDSHHLDARSKAWIRPKLLELGKTLEDAGYLAIADDVFTLSVSQIANYLDLLQEKFHDES